MALHDQTRKAVSGDNGEIASRLLGWYDAHHRDLPWRVATAGAGRRIPIVIQRDGAERELEIVSELRPQ